MKTAQNGTDVGAQIAKMIADAERAAYEKGYERGWDEAVAALTTAVARMPVRQPSRDAAKPKEQLARKAKPRQRRTVRNEGPSPARKIVLNTIKENAGLTGSEVAKMVAKDVNKHTVRTQLRKLRIAGEIEQEKMRWYATDATQRLL